MGSDLTCIHQRAVSVSVVTDLREFFIFKTLCMKKVFTLLCCTAAFWSLSAQQTVTLDLSKATTKLEFNSETGAWTDTYTDDATSIESQCFSLVHHANSEWLSWWGFTASTSYDNARPDNTLKFQFSNMTPGGIVLNEDGTVKVDEDGTPVTDKTMPYAVAYYSTYYAEPLQVAFNDGKVYEPVGAYFNLTSYTYYCVEFGDSYARAFRNGDKLTVTAHGVAPDKTEKTVEFDLASYANGNLTINRSWSYVDLSELGTVDEIYFTMTTTDVGDYGANTPLYFAMDKLTVKESASNALNMPSVGEAAITYDRASHIVRVQGADFAMITDVAGSIVMSGESSEFDISGLGAGVYIVKAGNSTLKLAR